ncbi:MAG: hypothetical protein ACRDTZ_02410 [Pseudonocardiaceae bacterium]
MRRSIRPALERLRAAGDFVPDATRRTLLGLGYADTDVEVQPMRVPSGWNSAQPPVGAVFAVHVGLCQRRSKIDPLATVQY